MYLLNRNLFRVVTDSQPNREWPQVWRPPINPFACAASFTMDEPALVGRSLPPSSFLWSLDPFTSSMKMELEAPARRHTLNARLYPTQKPPSHFPPSPITHGLRDPSVSPGLVRLSPVFCCVPLVSGERCCWPSPPSPVWWYPWSRCSEQSFSQT